MPAVTSALVVRACSRFVIDSLSGGARQQQKPTAKGSNRWPMDEDADGTCDPAALLGDDPPGLGDHQALDALDFAPFDLARGVRAFGARTDYTGGTPQATDPTRRSHCS